MMIVMQQRHGTFRCSVSSSLLIRISPNNRHLRTKEIEEQLKRLYSSLIESRVEVDDC